MRSSILWLFWLVLPVFALAYHYGPGQIWLARDQAAAMIQKAQAQSVAATDAQEAAYQSQLNLLDARRTAFVAGVDWQTQPNHPLAQSVIATTSQQDSAYELAAEAWHVTAELYGEATETLLKAMSEIKTKETLMSRADRELLESLRWAEARAMVRSGEVFNGIEQLQALLDLRVTEARQAASSTRPVIDASMALPTEAIREELAAAQYVGARLLREEGRPPEVWRPVANEARQHYRYLSAAESRSSVDTIASESEPVTNASRSSKPADEESEPSRRESQTSTSTLDRDQLLQRNLEQVLNLEQSTSDQLEGLPLPRSAPLARRPGDGEPGDQPGKGPGRGPLQDGPPAGGAGIPGPYGSGW